MQNRLLFTLMLAAAFFANACGPQTPPTAPASSSSSRASSSSVNGTQATRSSSNECTATLRLEESALPPGSHAEDSELFVPHTRVTVILICQNTENQRLELPEAVGPCVQRERGAALSQASCWWAGRSTRYILQRQDRFLVVKTGLSENDQEGPLTEIGRLEIPQGVESIRPLH